MASGLPGGSDIFGPTEIWVPQTSFPNGNVVTVSDPASTWTSTFDTTSGLLLVTAPSTGGTHSVHVSAM